MNEACGRRALLVLLAAAIYPSRASAQAVNANAQLVADFDNRVAGYMKLRAQAESGLPPLKPTDSLAAIKKHEQALAQRIRQARANAHKGDIFDPPITAEFRRLIAIALSGSKTQIERSLKHSEPVNPTVRVNGPYPSAVPLQSTPPDLLQNLPQLPRELEYRPIGHNLILRDTGANLVVDIAEQVIP